MEINKKWGDGFPLKIFFVLGDYFVGAGQNAHSCVGKHDFTSGVAGCQSPIKKSVGLIEKQTLISYELPLR